MLKDIDGNDVSRQDMPRLLDKHLFEGVVEFDHYLDAVEYMGTCQHCTGKVGGVLRLADPLLQKSYRSPAENQLIYKEIRGILRRKHQCSTVYSDKRDVTDWLKDIHRTMH